MNRNRIIAVLVLCFAFLMACAVAEKAGTTVLQLGTSVYTVVIPESFVEGELTAEDIEDDMVAYLHSPETEMDFDVYQFGKEGYPDTLTEFVKGEAAEYEAAEVVADDEINGIPVGWYRAVEEYEGEKYATLTFVMEDGDDYVEIAFWLDGETSEEEAKAIISTLALVAK